MIKLLVLLPKGIKKGQPSYERINSFIEFYKYNDYNILTRELPNSLLGLLKLVIYFKREQFNYIFISMPPFRNWLLFMFLNKKIILDIRDGWSIAIKTGYGGTVKPKFYKSRVVSLIEKYAIKRAVKISTCTPQLKKYLESLTGRKVILVLNGYSNEDRKIVERLKTNERFKKNNSELLVCCAGKFSEYGREKVKLIFKKLALDYPSKKIIFNAIGCKSEENKWVFNFLKKSNFTNIEFNIVDRMPKEYIYEELLNSDIAVTVIRDPEYDFGTKVFDYILCSVPILNYFEADNNFVNFFRGFFHDDNYKINFSEKDFLRNSLIRDKKELLLLK